MKKLLTIVLIMQSCILYAQEALYTIRDADNFYDRAVMAVERNDLLAADSLFARSYKIQPSANSLFNYAIIKMALNDTCTGCMYLHNVYSVYGDSNALEVYNTHCLYRYSITYFDKDYCKIANSAGWKYYEEIKNPKCESVIRGVIHKKGHGSSIDLMGFKSVDVVAQWVIIDTVKYYQFVFGSSFLEKNRTTIDAFEGRLKQYLNVKYDLSALPDNNRNLKVLLLIDKNGAVTGSSIEKNPFTFFDPTTRDVIETDLAESLRKMPPLKPEKLPQQTSGYDLYTVV